MRVVGDPPSGWLVFLRHDASNNYTFLRRQDITEASLHTLLHNGDIAMIHPMLAYVCDQMEQTAYVFRSIVPQFENFIRRALRECAFDYGPFGVQRLRFAVFEYFTRFVTRQLVAEAITTDSNWHYYVEVNNVENDIWGDWYEWFEQSGIFVDGTVVGFLAEAKQHYRKVRDLVQSWKDTRGGM